jgi:magnesium transporter
MRVDDKPERPDDPPADAPLPGAPQPQRPRGRRRSVLRRLLRQRRAKKPGSVAGIELDELATDPEHPGPVGVTVIDYGPERVQVREVEDVASLRGGPPARMGRGPLDQHRQGRDLRVIRALAEKYNLHPLAIEDVLHVTHRPKVEPYAEEGGTRRASSS